MKFDLIAVCMSCGVMWSTSSLNWSLGRLSVLSVPTKSLTRGFS